MEREAARGSQGSRELASGSEVRRNGARLLTRRVVVKKSTPCLPTGRDELGEDPGVKSKRRAHSALSRVWGSCSPLGKSQYRCLGTLLWTPDPLQMQIDVQISAPVCSRPPLSTGCGPRPLVDA